MAVAASLFVTVPLCAIVWVVVNFVLVRIDPSIYIEDTYLWFAILILSAVTFISPDFFTKILGFIFGTNKPQ